MRWVRRSSIGLTVVVVALGVMTYRVVSDGTAALEQSDAAFHRGDLPNTVLYARRAAIAYAPGAPHTRAALARLRAVATGSEGVGDTQSARLAWGAIRSAAIETRHVTLPYAGELEEANRALARLAVAPGLTDPDARAQAERRARAAFSGPPGPAPASAALLFTGFGIMAAGLLLVALRGITRQGRLVPRELALSLGVLAIGAACWTWALYRA
ncbi:MAG TPA: hypothetical protein VGK73_34675 [Polyangiaceae bacterium]